MKANMEAMKEMMVMVKKDTNNQNQDKGNSGKKQIKRKPVKNIEYI
jgi:hypothetical protein